MPVRPSAVSQPSTYLRLLAVLFTFALVAAACGGDDDVASEPSSGQEEPAATPTPAQDVAAEADDGSGDGTTEPTTEGAAPTEQPKDEDDGSALEELTDGDDGGGTDGDTSQQEGASTEVNGTPGAPGIGDPYYPSLGNGGYDVERYDLNLEWEPDRAFLSGTATITAVATQDLSSFNLDLQGMEVSSITIDGDAAQFAMEDPELVVTPAEDLANGSTFTAVISYSGEPRPAGPVTVIGDGGWSTLDDISYVAGEPGGAAGWFPVNDHPLDKAQYRLALTVPEGEVVAANGLLQSQTDNGSTVTWVYETAFPQAPYLTTVVIGDLELIEVGKVGDITIRHAIARELTSLVVPQLEDTGQMIEVLSDLFGPYPFEAYGIVLINESLGFALETQTLSFFGRDFLGSAAEFESVLVHELAHQWFGDSLSVAEWDEIWLNEGFATYAQYLYLEVVDDNYDIDQEMERISRFNPALLESPVPGDPGPQDLFAASVYFRGALTLHALRGTIGDDAFFTTVRTYVERNIGGNVETVDLLAIAEEISGQELDDFFNAWLYESPLPDLPN